MMTSSSAWVVLGAARRSQEDATVKNVAVALRMAGLLEPVRDLEGEAVLLARAVQVALELGLHAGMGVQVVGRSRHHRFEHRDVVAGDEARVLAQREVRAAAIAEAGPVVPEVGMELAVPE